MKIQAEHPILEVHDLTVSYNKKPVLWGVDFTLPKGVLVGIIGPNGRKIYPHQNNHGTDSECQRICQNV